LFQRILVPLDGTQYAEHAISVATRIAKATDATVVLMQVIPPAIVYGAYTPDRVIQESFEADYARANGYLTHLANEHSREEVNIQTQVLSGPVAVTILDFARTYSFDLIIINSRRHKGLARWMPGSVAAEVAFSSPRPVLVLRDKLTLAADSVANTARSVHTLVTLDGSAIAEAILLPAAQLSVALSPTASCVLHLLRVLNPPPISSTKKDQAQIEKDKQVREEAKRAAETYLSKVESRLREDAWEKLSFTVRSLVVFDNDAVAGIVAAVEQGKQEQNAEEFDSYDLVAIATHGRGDFQRLFIHSVTEDILKAIRLPLLIVRAPE
jgi:nucleotide-binding universal stress UspA family protein